MTSKTLPTQSASGGDIVKYALALLLAVAGLFAFYWFDGQWPTGVRVLAVVAGLVAGAVGIFALSDRFRAEGKVICWWLDGAGTRQGDPE